MTTSTTQPDIYATLLTDQQIWGDDQRKRNGQLQVMKAYGTKTGMSDLAIVLGGYMSTLKTVDGQRTGFVWSASSDGYGNVRAVDNDGDRSHFYPYLRLLGARPALPSSVTSSIRLSEAKPSRKISGVDMVEYGEYPQTIAPENIGNELEQAFSKKQLKGTGKKYTFDAEKYDAYEKPFKAKEHAEYEHRGKRYIRVEAQPIDGNSVLSNGHTPAKGEACWIEVQPIEWLVEPDKINDYFGKPEGVLIDNPTAGMLVARQALFAGVQFDGKGNYGGNFNNTEMYRYLQDHFMKEIVPSKAQEQAAGVLANDTTVPEEVQENGTLYQDIVAKGAIQDWSSRDFSAKPKDIHR